MSKFYFVWLFDGGHVDTSGSVQTRLSQTCLIELDRAEFAQIAGRAFALISGCGLIHMRYAFRVY